MIGSCVPVAAAAGGGSCVMLPLSRREKYLSMLVFWVEM
jgi:hypothetical protein